MKTLLLHWVTGGVGTMVMSAAARALAPPDPMGSKFYGWFYRFTQALLANWDKLK